MSQRDNSGGSLHLGQNSLLDPFFNATPHAYLQAFTILGPEASLDTVDVLSEGVECGF